MSVSVMPSMPCLDPELIHVWRLSISSASIDELLPILSDDERARASRFAFQKDHNQFVAVRGWLRQLLGAYLQQPPSQLRFAYGVAGKPQLDCGGGGVDLRFNVSHSHNTALLAFTVGREVGVDVEFIDNQVDVLELARTCFSPAERRALQACVSEKRLACFFRFWTAKESYIKALGGGLSIPLDAFTVDFRPDTTAARVRTRNPVYPAMTVHDLSLTECYSGAIAAEGTEWRVVVQDIS
jgi:4'-phosphopantetheinyl transferase